MQFRVILSIVLFVFVGCSYLPEEAIPLSTEYEISETGDYILIEPVGDQSEEGILFIPGGLVDAHAYISTFLEFVRTNNQKVLILKVRSNLAIFNMRQAERVRKDFEGDKWIIGGHSLGGVVAGMTVNNNRDEYEGLFFLGAYSTADIGDWDQPVFMILAENDGLTDLESVENNRRNLPEAIYADFSELDSLGDTRGNTIYYTIRGGNHGQFGNYGQQAGDGEATISKEEQQQELFEVLTILMRNNGFDV